MSQQNQHETHQQAGDYKPLNHDILFIDGECVLCNNLAKWLAKHSKPNSYKIGALQDHELHKSYGLTIPTDLKSLVFVTQDKEVHQKSNAVLKLSRHLKSPYAGLAKAMYIFPRFFRDWVYDFVASVRYKVFGRKEVCDLPSKELRDMEIKKPS